MENDWIGIGGGNYVDREELKGQGFNDKQIYYLCTIYPTCVRGMLLNEAGYSVHFDCHPSDYTLWEKRYLDNFQAEAHH